MPLQLDSDGLKTQTQQEIFDEIAAKLQSVFGNSLNTTIQSINGQFMNIMSELRALDQQALLAVWRSFDPNGAIGVSLDRLGVLTGSIRRGSSNSTVEGFITFSGPAVVADGTLFLNEDQNTQWETINGPYSDTGGPYPELVPAQLQALDAGPIQALALTNWAPITVIPNVTDFTNPTEDAIPGQDEETDAEFRQRRTIELFAPGQGPLATISALVSKVNTANGRVDLVRTYHNPTTMPVDANNIPFKAFNVVVETTPNPPPPGLQQDIFDAILTATGAGGYPWGTDYTGTAADEEGQLQPIAFDVVQEVDFYMQVEITTALSTGGEGPVLPIIPLNMAEIIRDAILEAAQGYKLIGRDVKEIDYVGVVTSLQTSGEISGIEDVSIDLSLVSKLGPYTPNFLPIGIREKADLDSVDIRVVIDGVAVIP